MEEYKSLVQKFEDDYEGTWGDFANDKIDWFSSYDTVLDESNAPFVSWLLFVI